MTNAKVIEKNDDLVVIEVDAGYSATFLELPGSYSPESFFKATEVVEIQKQDCHTCPHASSSKFDKIRKGVSEEGKTHDVLYGRVIGTNRWEVASFMYEKAEWSDEEAKEHCKSHGGVAFEKAVEKVEESERRKALLEIDVDGVKKSIELESIVKKDDMKHLIFGVALEPGIVDSQGDFETPETIQLAIHKFMYKMWESPERPMVGSQHVEPILSAVPVQCFQAPNDFWYKDTPKTSEYMIKAGSWVLVTHVKDDDEFAKAVSGEYLGYSIQGTGKRRSLQ